MGEVLEQLPGTKSLPRSAGPDSCWQGWGEGSFVVPGLVGRQSFGLPAARHMLLKIGEALSMEAVELSRFSVCSVLSVHFGCRFAADVAD